MKDPLPQNPLTLLFNPERQKTRRMLIKEMAAFTGMVAIPLRSIMAAGPIDLDLPKPKPAKTNLPKNSSRGNIITLTAQDSAMCLHPLEGDINGDCRVDTEDLQIMRSDWLTNDASARSNLDSAYSYIPGPGSSSTRVYVDYLDFQILSDNWLKCSLPECI